MAFSVGSGYSILRRGIRAGLLAATIALLGACGGGGGGDNGGGSAYSISASTANFAATQGGAAPAAQTVTVTVNSGVVFIATTQSGSEFSHVFQITGPVTGDITITPNAPVNGGTFTGTITVRGCSDDTCSGSDVAGSPQTISVTYQVSPVPTLSSMPAALDFVTSTGVTPAAKTLSLSLSTGAAGWTSQIDYTGGTPGWLSITPDSGTLPQTLTVNAGVTSIPAGTYTATITFGAGGLTKTVPATLTVKDPTVNFVSPYVATTSVGGDVIIRGYGFSVLAAGTLQVQFGGTPSTTATIVSDTEIHAHHPDLVAGSHTVTVGDASQTFLTRARLVVVDPPAFPYTAIERNDSPTFAVNLTYDGERRAIYLVDADRNRIERYKFNGTTWDTASRIVGGGGVNSRMALSPDGTEILKTGRDTMSRIDPETLASIDPDGSALSALGPGIVSLNMIAFANDGGAIGNVYAPTSGTTLYRYDMLTRQFTVLSTLDLTNRSIVASGNGSTLVLPSIESLIPSFAKPVITYNSSDGNLTERSVITTRTEHASLDRTGSKIILTTAEFSPDQVTTVYNSSLVAQGVLPDASHNLRGFVISPDGTKAYAYYSGTGTMRKFDLTTPSGGGFAELGAGTPVPDSPGVFFNDMTISADGGTLFLAGNERVIIMPAP